MALGELSEGFNGPCLGDPKRNRSSPFSTLNGDRSRVGGGWGWGRVSRSLATGESKNDYQDGNGWPVIVPATVVVRGSTPIPCPPGGASRGRFSEIKPPHNARRPWHLDRHGARREPGRLA